MDREKYFIIKRQRQFIESIQPIINLQVKILNFQSVRYIQQGDNWLREIIWHPESKKVYDQLTEFIEYQKEKCLNESILW